MDTVSIILPVYNGSTGIVRAIDSMLNQTFKDFELIIIDNGSTDDTVDKINAFNDSRIKLLKLPKPNLVAALNHGIAHSTAKYIARMDADDWSHPDRLQLQVCFLQKNSRIGVVSSLVKYHGSREKNYGYYLHVEWLNEVISHDEIFLKRFQDSPLAHPSVMFRKSLVNEFGGYEEGNFPEDYELWLRWMSNGVRMAKIQKPLLHWHDSPNRLSRIHPAYSEEAFAKTKTKYFAKWFLSHFAENQPTIWICGKGRIINRKVAFLEAEGLKIAGFVDFKANSSSNGKPIINYQSIASLDNAFILSYVSDRVGKLKIHEFLTSQGFAEGKKFYMMA